MITHEEIRRQVEEKDVRYLRLIFTDILGTIKNVEVPITQLDKVLANKMMFDGSSIEGFVRIEESDMYLYPDLSTWVVFPWSSKHGTIARLICDVYKPDGTPFAGDPRSNLKRVLNEMKELGFSNFNLGPEPEFFLFKMDENGEPTLEGNDQGSYFDLAPIDLGEECRREIVLELEKIGFDIEASHHEVAPGQHEIDWKYSDAVAACDNIQTFKLVVKTIARKHGLHATFMPKPVFGIAGSGMHFNLSLFDKDGNNAFFDENGDQRLSDTCRHFIAGVMKHAKALTAVCNPTVNSYKRLVPGFEAPVLLAYSASNRSASIRIPAVTSPKAIRIETRFPDPLANPYLAFAALLMAGLDGVVNKIHPGDAMDKNLYDLPPEELKDIPAVASSLEEALNSLEKDYEFLTQGGVFAKDFIEAFINIKRKEVERLNMTPHPVEFEMYYA